MSFNGPEFVHVSGKVGDRFVGLRLKEDRLTFQFPLFLPAGRAASEDRALARAVLRSIAFAKRTLAGSHARSLASGPPETGDSIGAMFFLIDDYRTFGRYVNREKRKKADGKGRIDWRLTLRQQPFQVNGTYVFPHLLTEEKTEAQCLLSEIYKVAVKKSIDFCGWLFDAQVDDYLLTAASFDKRDYPFLIATVRKAIGQTFDDLKRRRLSSMENVLSHSYGCYLDRKDFSYGTDNFEDAFEVLLRMVMTSSAKPNPDYNPHCSYALLGGGPLDVSALRPDIVFRENGRTYIFDAKYYSYASSFDPKAKALPGSESIMKQLFYAEYLGKKYPLDEIVNSFLLPFDFSSDIVKGKSGSFLKASFQGHAALVGSAGQSGASVLPINVVLVDLAYLLSSWRSSPASLRKEIMEVLP